MQATTELPKASANTHQLTAKKLELLCYVVGGQDFTYTHKHSKHTRPRVGNKNVLKYEKGQKMLRSFEMIIVICAKFVKLLGGFLKKLVAFVI